MLFGTARTILEEAQKGARKILSDTNTKPKVLFLNNLYAFLGCMGYSARLILREKEILFFAVLQWVVISLAYTMWTQILDWIPDSLWAEVGKPNNSDDGGAFKLINLALLGWSFLVVTVASYPISILNGAMTASHYLRSSNQESTIAKCLGLAFKNLGRLWAFTTIDAWITVKAILRRLPKKHQELRASDELLYYAWKIGTVGVLPALVAGKGYRDATRDSITILKEKPTLTIGIRMGYSLVCWIIGIAAYIGAIYYFAAYGDHNSKVNRIYNFYFLMAVPIFIAVGINSVLVRPFYLIAISKLYTDTIPLANNVTDQPKSPGFDLLALFFAVLFSVLLSLYFFGDQLGIKEWIESLAAKDINAYQEQF